MMPAQLQMRLSILRLLLRAALVALVIAVQSSTPAAGDPVAEAGAFSQQAASIYQEGPLAEAEPLLKRMLAIRNRNARPTSSECARLHLMPISRHHSRVEAAR